MDWVEVVAIVVGIIIVLNSVSYWRAMFIIEFFVPRYFLVLLLMFLIFFHCYVSA